MARPPKPRFVLHLEAQPKHGDDNGMRRLRGLLKALLRGWGMRCTWIEYPPELAPGDDDYARPIRPAAGKEGESI